MVVSAKPSAWRELVRAEARRRGINADAYANRVNEYCPWQPQPKQREFMQCDAKFVLYGGAMAGGKSVAVLMDALQFVHIPGFSALILRRSLIDLKQANALMDMAKMWFAGTRARWDAQTYTWTFPSGAKIQFGYCDTENDVRRYFGGSWIRIYVDEAQQFPWEWLTKLMQRARKPKGMKVKVSFRCTANPIDISKIALREFFIENQEKRDNVVYIPAKMSDNAELDVDDYRQSMAILDDVTRAALENGDWYAAVAGKYCTPEMFQKITSYDVPPHVWEARAYDISLTGKGDATATVKVCWMDGALYLLDAAAEPLKTPQVKEQILGNARTDAVTTVVGIENQTASLTVIHDMEEHDYFEPLGWTDEKAWAGLPSYEAARPRRAKRMSFTRVPLRGNKLERASALLQDLHDMKVFMVEGRWNRDLVEQFTSWTGADGEADDLIDAAVVAREIATRLPQRTPRLAGTEVDEIQRRRYLS